MLVGVGRESRDHGPGEIEVIVGDRGVFAVGFNKLGAQTPPGPDTGNIPLDIELVGLGADWEASAL